MSPPEPSYPTTTSPENPDTTEAHENDLKTNFTKMIEVLKKKNNRFLKECQESKTSKQIFEGNK